MTENPELLNLHARAGKCTQCNAIYYADHERFTDNYGSWYQCYLNSGQFLKIGQSMWADRKFTHSILSGNV